MADNYANAADVLPRELLVVLQHFHIGHLWVPHPDPNKDRDEQIWEMKQRGLTHRDIAKEVKLSERRVGQILQRLREIKQHAFFGRFEEGTAAAAVAGEEQRKTATVYVSEPEPGARLSVNVEVDAANHANE